MKYEVWFKGALLETVEPDGEPCAAENAAEYAVTFLDACVEQWCVEVKAKNAAGEIILELDFATKADWSRVEWPNDLDPHTVLAAGGRWWMKAASGETFSILSVASAGTLV